MPVIEDDYHHYHHYRCPQSSNCCPYSGKCASYEAVPE
jgi:hypothetical protein